jgi:hypothetical protein
MRETEEENLWSSKQKLEENRYREKDKVKGNCDNSFLCLFEYFWSEEV